MMCMEACMIHIPVVVFVMSSGLFIPTPPNRANPQALTRLRSTRELSPALDLREPKWTFVADG
ncbi:hypothetical protein BDV93DRAFT_521195 [Ceratobasidium sp. AG-I]|nr:hypothetical protein BDV93DRAFT_521195 [Ceratobasidium sp. AG-I]